MALSASEIQDQNRSEVPTQTTTNTGYGNLIMKCVATRQSFTLPQYSTLNEKYNTLAAESIGRKNGQDFELKYFGVGIRGANCIGQNALGVSRMKVNQHQPIDMNLFTAIPFICRPIDEDLNNIQRAKYRMRVVMNGYDGNSYVFYFLKLINFDHYNPQVSKITRDENGNETPVPYVPSRDDLFNPQPVDFTSEGSVPISNTYLNSSAILGCSLDQGDLKELADACRVLYNDASYAAINETMIAWGIDTITDGSTGGGAVVRYDEVLSAVAAHYITERDARNALNNTQLNLDFDHGASEPMLLHTTATISPGGQGN